MRFANSTLLINSVLAVSGAFALLLLIGMLRWGGRIWYLGAPLWALLGTLLAVIYLVGSKPAWHMKILGIAILLVNFGVLVWQMTLAEITFGGN